MKKNFDLFLGCLGSGITIANRAVMEGGDYKTIGHISPAGRLKLYVAPETIPTDAFRKIKAAADTAREEARMRLESGLNAKKDFQRDHYRGRIMEEIARYTTSETFDSFFEAYRAAASDDEKNAVIIATYLQNF